MNEMATDSEVEEPTAATPGAAAEEGTPEQDLALVKKLMACIKEDKRHHEAAFKRMRRDMFVTRHGRSEDWHEDNYKANITGRHVKQLTNALYAKNPKIVARRRETLDFVLWDENPESIQMAMQAMAMAQQAAAATPSMEVDPQTGGVQTVSPIPPEMEAAFEQARALLQDYQQGMARRMFFDKLGRTLEVLFNNAMREQKPLDFKRAAKALVRRTATTGVGYIEIGFQRTTGPRAGLNDELADARARLDHLRRLSEELAEGDMDETSAERAELEHAIQALTAEPEVIMREGLVFDFPQSTKVIPDKYTKSVVGFVGARHLTIEYDYTRSEVEEKFPGVDLGESYVAYDTSGKSTASQEAANLVRDDADYDSPDRTTRANDMIRVWKHYDKPSGLVYYLADGYKKFLRPPAPPEVFVEDFWPVYALTFNEVESEDSPFPPSNVTLMLDMQNEHNRSRQGKREHRDAARPRWIAGRSAFSDEDAKVLQKLQPFETGFINKDPAVKIGDLLEPLPVPGVDPNLYQTDEVFTDTQLVVGAQEAQFGGVSKATATESAIAAGSTQASDDSSKDDLDSFLSTVARAGSQILIKEMSEEQVKKIAGPGAVWATGMPLSEIAEELYLEIEAGSSGRPNQAVEIQNWDRMLPYLIQIPGIDPIWIAQETVRRLDDRVDLTKAIKTGMPSIVAMNAQKQPGTGDPATSPEQQGAEGQNNAPQGEQGAGGSDPAFGSNQV